MSRVLVVGMGVPSLVAAKRHSGPGLRSAHFASALSDAGHDVLLMAVLDEGDAAPEGDDPPHPGPRIEFVTERQLASPLVRARIARFAPQAVVGATVYASALAARLRLGVPLWADAFGDLMAEAQAKAARASSDWSLVHFWTLLRTVLESGDHFSAVSSAQSHALVGQLGLAGRLSSRTAGEELVTVVPCAARVPAGGSGEGPSGRVASRRELGFDEEDFVLLVSGGVNTWCDVETLGDALALAFDADARLRVVVTGGAIPGHDETSHRTLLARLAALPPSRVRILGWTPSSRLPAVYAAADLALHVERPLYERRLGAENRVVEWLAHGLACVTTAQSESGAELAAAGLSIACAPGQPQALAQTILAAAGDPAVSPAARVLPHARDRGPRWVEAERSFAATAAPLAGWCAEPRFARDRDGARLLQIGLVSQPATSAEMLEAYVAELPLREILRRGVRWLARRAGAAILGAASACAKTKDAAGRAVRRTRGLPPSLLLVAFLASTLAGGCTRAATPRSNARPNILLLSIDTLRYDHLGAYGYAATPSPTPWLDDLAKRSMLFETAVTSAPETAPALATLLTGVYQDRHGVFYNRGRMDDEPRTLAERLKEAGYATVALVGNLLADPTHGFAQGFDRYEMVPSGQAIDDRITALAGDFLRAPPDRPWFLWVHMMDPHGPSSSAPPWWSRSFDYSKAPLANDGEYPVSDSNFGLGVIPAYQKLEGVTRLSDYVRRYDGDVRFTDSQAGSLLAMLAATGQRDSTIVVVVADHGESLSEHGELLQHGWFLYEPTVRVPLLVSWPGHLPEGARVREEVCGVDLVPSLLDLASVAADGADFDGRSFVPADGRAPSVSAVPDEAAWLRAAGCFVIGPRHNRLLSLRGRDHKLVVTPAGTSRDPHRPKDETQDPETIELYDLAADPGETSDVARSKPDVADEMKQSITSLRSRFRAHGWRW